VFTDPFSEIIAAHDDAPLGEAELLADLQHLIPARLTQGRRPSPPQSCDDPTPPSDRQLAHVTEKKVQVDAAAVRRLNLARRWHVVVSHSYTAPFCRNS
jgi:hypothetical protein